MIGPWRPKPGQEDHVTPAPTKPVPTGGSGVQTDADTIAIRALQSAPAPTALQAALAVPEVQALIEATIAHTEARKHLDDTPEFCVLCQALAALTTGGPERAFQASCEGVVKAFQAAALNISDVDDRGRRHFLPGVVLDELNGARDQLRPGVQYRVDGTTITFRYVPKTGEPLVASMIEEIDGSPPKGGDPIPPQLALLLRPARNIEQED